MSELLNGAVSEPRLLIQAKLQPIQGTRFQPTGFPSLGAAEFRGPDGAAMILVESAQSMANRLENVAWDDASGDLVEDLRGLPYVATTVDGRATDSIREAHRLNSPYLGAIIDQIAERMGIARRKKKGADGAAQSSGIDIRDLAKAAFYYDPNSVLHGVFLEKLMGTARLTRILSSFIEATDTKPVESGGVKNDRVHPTAEGLGGAKGGFGNVPFSRTEYTAKAITAYFSIDAALLRSYGLGRPAEDLLIALALWKISRLLERGTRLRTACDLEATEIRVTRPKDGELPTPQETARVIREAIGRCAAEGLFAHPPKTMVEFTAQ